LRTQGASSVNFAGVVGNLVVQNNRRWVNEGTLTIGGDDRVMLGSGACCAPDTPVLINASGATIVLASSNTQPLLGNSWATARVDNEGLIRKTTATTQSFDIIPPSAWCKWMRARFAFPPVAPTPVATSWPPPHGCSLPAAHAASMPPA
jgi:hypothetical protein